MCTKAEIVHPLLNWSGKFMTQSYTWNLAKVDSFQMYVCYNKWNPHVFVLFPWQWKAVAMIAPLPFISVYYVLSIDEFVHVRNALGMCLPLDKKKTRRIAPCCFLISIELHIHLCSCLSKYREIAKIYQRLLCKLISFKSVDIYHQRAGLGLGCLMPLSTMFQYMVAVSFIGAGNLSIRRKPPTCLKSLTNFIA
jgi:hypothetical protein